LTKAFDQRVLWDICDVEILDDFPFPQGPLRAFWCTAIELHGEIEKSDQVLEKD